MPSRLIREGIISSDRVDQLDPAAEVFYRRLLNKIDDHGLYDARPSILLASLYPLRLKRVKEADCSRWLAACVCARLVAVYEVGGKPYLKVLDTRWQMRSAPKYPIPPENACLQPATPVHLDVVVVGSSKSSNRGASAPDGFEILWRTYPRRAGNNPKARAEKAYRARIAEKHTPQELLDGAARYAKFIRTTGKEGTEFVLMAATFLGTDKPFLQPWAAPHTGASEPLAPSGVGTQACGYCETTSTGLFAGRLYCDAHQADAWAQKPALRRAA